MFNPLKFVIKILVEGEKDLRDLATSFDDVAASAENMEVGAKAAADELGEIANGAKGWVDPYANAAAEMDELADAFNASQNPIKKTAEELGKASGQADLLGTAIKGVGLVSPTAAAQLTRLSSIATTLGPGAIAAAAGLAAIAAGYVAIKAAGDFANKTLEDTVNATEDQIEVAEEFVELEHRLKKVTDATTMSFEYLWDQFGYGAAREIAQLVKFLDLLASYSPIQIGLPQLGDKGGISGLSKAFEEELKNIEKAGKATADYMGGVWSSIFGGAQADLKGENTAKFIADMLYREFAIGGWQEKEVAAYSKYLVDNELATPEVMNAYIDAFNTGMNIIGTVAGETTTAANEAKTAVEAISTAIKGIPKDTTVYIHVIETKGAAKEGSGASGGNFGAGQRILVGDKPGGIPTPYSEIVEGLPGGGIKVYNASQTRGMRSMAGGGTIGGGSDITDELIGLMRGLPAVIARAVETKVLRNAR